MTVDESHEVLNDKLDEIRSLVEKQNGRVTKAEEDITKLKVHDAYWAGGVMVVLAVIKLLVG